MKPRAWSAIEGWFTPQEAEVYAALAGSIRCGVVVELGVWKGRSIASILDVCRANRNRLYAVDTWDRNGRDPGYAEAARHDIGEVFRANVCSLGHGATVQIIRHDSARAASLFADRTVDLVFLDADHAYESVIRDLAAWMPKIQSRGVFCGHDYTTYPGVKRAVDELFGDRVALPGGSIWAVRSRPIAFPSMRRAFNLGDSQ